MCFGASFENQGFRFELNENLAKKIELGNFSAENTVGNVAAGPIAVVVVVIVVVVVKIVVAVLLSLLSLSSSLNIHSIFSHTHYRYQLYHCRHLLGHGENFSCHDL